MLIVFIAAYVKIQNLVSDCDCKYDSGGRGKSKISTDPWNNQLMKTIKFSPESLGFYESKEKEIFYIHCSKELDFITTSAFVETGTSTVDSQC